MIYNPDMKKIVVILTCCMSLFLPTAVAFSISGTASNETDNTAIDKAVIRQHYLKAIDNKEDPYKNYWEKFQASYCEKTETKCGSASSLTGIYCCGDNSYHVCCLDLTGCCPSGTSCCGKYCCQFGDVCKLDGCYTRGRSGGGGYSSSSSGLGFIFIPIGLIISIIIFMAKVICAGKKKEAHGVGEGEGMVMVSRPNNNGANRNANDGDGDDK